MPDAVSPHGALATTICRGSLSGGSGCRKGALRIASNYFPGRRNGGTSLSAERTTMRSSRIRLVSRIDLASASQKDASGLGAASPKSEVFR
jgi:hypothetical protein